MIVAETTQSRTRSLQRLLAWSIVPQLVFLLGLGCDFRVDSPPELRAEFGRLAQRSAALAHYTDP